MKSFAVSVFIFCVLLCVILTNYAYVLRVCEDLEQKADALPECSEAMGATGELLALWEKESGKLKLSISLRQIEKMEECLSDLHYAASHGDARIFEQSRSRIKAVIDDIRNGEMPLPENFM